MRTCCQVWLTDALGTLIIIARFPPCRPLTFADHIGADREARRASLPTPDVTDDGSCIAGSSAPSTESLRSLAR